MGVNHRRRDIFVSEQFLNCPDVVTGLKQMCSKTVAKSVAAGGLVHTAARMASLTAFWRFFSEVW
jgi:hypothetical protein